MPLDLPDVGGDRHTWGTTLNAALTALDDADATAAADAAVAYGAGLSRSANVRTPAYGAVGNGVADDTAALQAALNAAVTTAVIPRGSYRVTSTLTVPAGVSVVVEPGARVWAAAAMTAVFATSTAFTRSNSFTGGGVIDAAELADHCILLRWFANVRVNNLRLDNAKVAALKLGETGAGGRSAEAVVNSVHIYRHTNPIPAGNNFGLLVENSGDHSISQLVVQSYRTGVFMASGTSVLSDVHVWHDPALGEHHTSFEDNGSGNVYLACYADTPSTYGFRLRQFNTRVEACTVYLNPAYGSDNIVRGVRFEQPDPFAIVLACQFSGGDATHRIAVDVEGNTDLGSVTQVGNRIANVQTVNSASNIRTLTTRELTFTDKGALPAATAALRGQLVTVHGASGARDALFQCVRDSDGGYRWQQLAAPGGLVGNFVEPGFVAQRKWDAASRCYFWRVRGAGGPLSKVRLKVAVSSGNIALSVYRGNGELGTAARPGTRLATTGSIACPAAGNQEISLGASLDVRDGDWIAMSCDNIVAEFVGGPLAGAWAADVFEGHGGYQSAAHPPPSAPVIAVHSYSGAALLRLVP